MPENCVNEVLPHLMKAEKDAADAPAPLVWVYPMREYTTSQDAALLREMHLGDSYVTAAINDGLPLCCVVSTDNFLKHSEEVYRRSILLSPVPENPAVLERLEALAEAGIGVLIYGTEEKLNALPRALPFAMLDVAAPAARVREALSTLGYEISFVKRDEGTKPPTMAISRRDNALLFSVYNANTTTDTHLRFPHGAPILLGAEAEIIGGRSSYRFGRGEHRECRVFVKQAGGVISCREHPPVNTRFRRAIKIKGLSDATVYLFPEQGCEAAVSIAPTTDHTPELDPRFREVRDEVHGTYLKGEHISGMIYFLMGHRG